MSCSLNLSIALVLGILFALVPAMPYSHLSWQVYLVKGNSREISFSVQIQNGADKHLVIEEIKATCKCVRLDGATRILKRTIVGQLELSGIIDLPIPKYVIPGILLRTDTQDEVFIPLDLIRQ